MSIEWRERGAAETPFRYGCMYERDVSNRGWRANFPDSQEVANASSGRGSCERSSPSECPTLASCGN